ncbi:hypothetical protein F442_07434 [Phytophthora nicotianae P10297]|uniref:Uncharacterized protein n=1 Tax=Phytophthora nicotianae P10297 TaxID=1317064 RepID=W2ZG95_PHYNI|nr:hypothetical protein F442_07434 [Phytophthora nicotianae P10297]
MSVSTVICEGITSRFESSSPFEYVQIQHQEMMLYATSSSSMFYFRNQPVLLLRVFLLTINKAHI